MARRSTKADSTSEFSAERMFKAIEGGPPRLMTGVVKRAEDDPKVIRFAKAVEGSQWVDVPESAVADFEHLGHLIRDGMQLPLVNLYLKPPEHPREAAYLNAQESFIVAVNAPRLGAGGALSNSKGDCIPLGNGQWWCPS